ncbi:MAG: hypothetical protein V9G22_15825 [Ottowia sp.]
MPALTEGLRRIHDAAEQRQLRGADVDRLNAGVVAVQALRDALAALVEQHDRWQQVDNDLRLASTDPDQSLEDLALVWPGVKDFLASACGVGAEAWAAELAKDADALDGALVSGDAARLRRTFNTCRRRCTHRFFAVDRQLKELCEQVGKIGGPLDAIEEGLR